MSPQDELDMKILNWVFETKDQHQQTRRVYEILKFVSHGNTLALLQQIDQPEMIHVSEVRP